MTVPMVAVIASMMNRNMASLMEAKNSPSSADTSFHPDPGVVLGVASRSMTASGFPSISLIPDLSWMKRHPQGRGRSPNRQTCVSVEDGGFGQIVIGRLFADSGKTLYKL